MIAVDTNLLVYAHRGESPFHRAAVEAMDRLVDIGRPWAVVWQCVHEFAAIVTHPRIYRPPTTIGQCLEEIENSSAVPDVPRDCGRSGPLDRVGETAQGGPH